MDVDLLINAGLYHDRNLGEPALAALIQDDIGANRDDPHEGGHGTFSFDVANGACGMLTALQIADGFLAAGTIRHALVVASDVHPGRHLAPHFRYAPVAGALLCRWHDGPAGLTGFRFASDPAGSELFQASVRFERNRNQLRIAEAPTFAAQAAVCAAKVAQELLADNGLTPGDLDLVVANPRSATFLDPLAIDLGVEPNLMVAAEGRQIVHTAGLGVALDVASQQGRLAGTANVLLVSAGAGIIAGAALLRNHRGH